MIQVEGKCYTLQPRSRVNFTYYVNTLLTLHYIDGRVIQIERFKGCNSQINGLSVLIYLSSEDPAVIVSSDIRGGLTRRRFPN